MNMFKRGLKINIKEELVRKKKTYENLNEFIIIVIEIDDAWYDFNLQKKFEKNELERVELFQKELIKYREERLIKERFYDDEIVSMKLNFIDKFKKRELKKQWDKRGKKKDEQACYFYEKKKHFVKDCRSINVVNRRKLNVLQIKLVKEKFRENVENESKFPKVITNNEYYRIKNIDELKQVLKRKASNNALVNTKKINKEIRSTFKKKLMTPYSSNRETRSNDEYECDTTFEQQLNKVVETLEEVLSNDANTQSKCCTTKCWTMCHDNECEKCRNWKAKHCEAIANEQQCKINHCQWHKRSWKSLLSRLPPR